MLLDFFQPRLSETIKKKKHLCQVRIKSEFYVSLVVCVRDLLALALELVAVKAIVETASTLTLHVALAIVEIPPTLQGSAALVPGVVEIE